MKNSSPLTFPLAAALFLQISCGSDILLEKHHVSNADPSPTIAPPAINANVESAAAHLNLDLAAPSKFETATFALG